MGKLVGSGRGISGAQDLHLYPGALNQAGCEFVFRDKVSGARARRPDLDAWVAAREPRG